MSWKVLTPAKMRLSETTGGIRKRFGRDALETSGEPPVIEERTIHAFVAVADPRNSLFRQAVLLNASLSRLFRVPSRVHATRSLQQRDVDRLVSQRDPVLFHYGSFDRFARQFAFRPHTTFVYHNYTPPRFFWKWAPQTALFGGLTSMQLRRFPRDLRWVAVSPFNKTCLTQLGFNEVAVCPCIITARADGNEGQRKTVDPSLIFVGRIAPNKNCLSLLAQIAIAADIVKRPLNLRLVGDVKAGSPLGLAFRSMLRKLKNHRWLRVSWSRDEMSDAEMDAALADAWLYVSTSLHEGFGLPACEAILRGTPALYLECGGQESILDDEGKIGLASEGHFGEAVADLIRDEGRRLGLLARQVGKVRAYASGALEPVTRLAYESLF